MRKFKFISILLVLSMLLTVPAFAFSLDFTDVPENAVYAESVSYLADAGKRTRKEQQPRTGVPATRGRWRCSRS